MRYACICDACSLKFKLQTRAKLNLDVTDFLDSPRKSELEVLLYADCISYCNNVSYE